MNYEMQQQQRQLMLEAVRERVVSEGKSRYSLIRAIKKVKKDMIPFENRRPPILDDEEKATLATELEDDISNGIYHTYREIIPMGLHSC